MGYVIKCFLSMSHYSISFRESTPVFDDPIGKKKSRIPEKLNLSTYIYICQVSSVICHMSGVRCQVSIFMCQVSCVRCHMSCVRCHVAGVTCQVLPFACLLLLTPAAKGTHLLPANSPSMYSRLVSKYLRNQKILQNNKNLKPRGPIQ